MAAFSEVLLQFDASSVQDCVLHYQNYTAPNNELYCNWTWDSFLCWPPTKANSGIKQKCSLIKGQRGLDPSQFATRFCTQEGKWAGRHFSEANFSTSNTSNPRGWTNYSVCYIQEVRDIWKKLGGSAEEKLAIASNTRVLEIVGFTISLAALVISLGIFYHFRGLRNNRTRIHKNLFSAMVTQVVVRLTLYLDQAMVRGLKAGADDGALQGIDNTPYLCVSCYIMLEYARTAMFLWMFIEGVYLHGIVTVSVFTSQRFPLLGYCLLGWGLPALMTTAWATTTALKHSAVARDNCWYGYNLSPYYWILEGPRLGVIVLNFMFLLNIVRVLVVKLRQSNTSDIQQVRKAVRAAVVLLPLLGITNVLNMADAPLDGTVLEFALWSYITHILTSFQGFFIALIYCFLNGEVRSAIAKKVNLHLSLRSTASGSRHSLSAGTPKGLSRFWTYLCLYDKGSKNRVHRGSERRRYPRGSSTVQHDLTSIADDRDYTEVLQKLSQDEVGDAAAAVGHNMLCFTDKEDNNIALITYLKENKPT